MAGMGIVKLRKEAIDPCRLARQVNKSCQRRGFRAILRDSCQLAWQVNEFFGVLFD
jgi:thiamine monophosphate synthase